MSYIQPILLVEYLDPFNFLIDLDLVIMSISLLYTHSHDLFH